MKEIKNLFKVKSLLSLMFGITTCFLACKGQISKEAFMSIVGSIIAFYFTKDNKKGDE